MKLDKATANNRLSLWTGDMIVSIKELMIEDKIIRRKIEAQLESSGCWTRKKNRLRVSITEQRREICPVEILNILLCNLLTFSPTHRLSALRGHPPLKWSETDRQRGWWDGWRCIKFLLSQHTQGGSLPLRSLLCSLQQNNKGIKWLPGKPLHSISQHARLALTGQNRDRYFTYLENIERDVILGDDGVKLKKFIAHDSRASTKMLRRYLKVISLCPPHYSYYCQHQKMTTPLSREVTLWNKNRLIYDIKKLIPIKLHIISQCIGSL